MSKHRVKRYSFWSILRGTIGLTWLLVLIGYGIWLWIEFFNGNSDILDSPIPIAWVIMLISIIGTFILLNLLIRLVTKTASKDDIEFICGFFDKDKDYI